VVLEAGFAPVRVNLYQAAAQYFVNERSSVIERSMQDANALAALLTPALQGAPTIWLPREIPSDFLRFYSRSGRSWTS
jgi:hypothetical protein